MTIVWEAVVGIWWLAVGVVDLHYYGYLALKHHTIKLDLHLRFDHLYQGGAGNCSDVGSSKLVSLVYCVRIPLCPEHEVLKH